MKKYFYLSLGLFVCMPNIVIAMSTKNTKITNRCFKYIRDETAELNRDNATLEKEIQRNITDAAKLKGEMPQLTTWYQQKESIIERQEKRFSYLCKINAVLAITAIATGISVYQTYKEVSNS